MISKLSRMNDDYRESFFRKIIKRLLGVKVRELISDFSGKPWVYKKEIDDKKVIFVHVPKAAGTSIAKAIYGKRMGHFPASAYYCVSREKFKNYYTFGFVRNPYARLYSAWRYLALSPHGEDRAWFEENISSFKCFKSFVMSWLDVDKIYSWKHFVPQTEYVCINGLNMLDDVFKVEYMGDAIKKLESNLGINLEVQKENASGSGVEWIDEYDEETASVVYSIYKKDFENFGYSKELFL